MPGTGSSGFPCGAVESPVAGGATGGVGAVTGGASIGGGGPGVSLAQSVRANARTAGSRKRNICITGVCCLQGQNNLYFTENAAFVPQNIGFRRNRMNETAFSGVLWRLC